MEKSALRPHSVSMEQRNPFVGDIAEKIAGEAAHAAIDAAHDDNAPVYGYLDGQLVRVLPDGTSRPVSSEDQKAAEQACMGGAARVHKKSADFVEKVGVAWGLKW